MIGELSEQKQESTPCTHFRIESLRVNEDARNILCQFSMGRLDKKDVFHPAPHLSNMSVVLNDENYEAAKGARCSKETVAETLQLLGIL